jgi:hypothetical protein
MVCSFSLQYGGNRVRTSKEEEKQYRPRYKIVEAIVNRVVVFEDKSIKVEFVFDLSEEKIRQAPPLLQ